MICKMRDDEVIKKHEIKKFQIGNTKIKVIIPEMTVAQFRKNLISFYDTVNDIASHCEKRGVDTSSWFYTEEQIEKMKKDPKYIFF